MREIKFRCWETKAKSYRDIESIEFFKGNLDVVTTVNDNGTDPQPVLGKEFILEQYTGLKDKNGKEIYEGDIVKGEMGTFELKWYSEVAQYMFIPNMEMKWHPPFVKRQAEDMEVIGNIHENPELLK